MEKFFCKLFLSLSLFFVPIVFFFFFFQSAAADSVKNLKFQNGENTVSYCPLKHFYNEKPVDSFPIQVILIADNLNDYPKGINFYYRPKDKKSYLKVAANKVVLNGNQAELEFFISPFKEYEVIARGIYEDGAETTDSTSIFFRVENYYCNSYEKAFLSVNIEKENFLKGEQIFFRIKNTSSRVIEFFPSALEIKRKLNEIKTAQNIIAPNVKEKWEEVSWVTQKLKTFLPCDCDKEKTDCPSEENILLPPQGTTSLVWDQKSRFCDRGKKIELQSLVGTYVADLKYSVFSPEESSGNLKTPLFNSIVTAREFKISGNQIQEKIDGILIRFSDQQRQQMKLLILLLPLLITAFALWKFRDL